MSVLEAVESDLKALPDELAGSALAATARQLAREMDGDNSATSKSMCAARLMEALDRLRALAPAKKEADRVDELSDRRAKRRASAAAS
jgi:hypothetical protein